MHEDLLAKLEQRLGPVHAKQRLGIETDHEAQAFGQGLTFFHIENWYSVHSVIRKHAQAGRPLRTGKKECRAHCAEAQ